MAKECQVLLTFYQRGRLVSTGANSAKRAEIKKMNKFKGAVDPKDGKYKPMLDVDFHIKNKIAFPKGYYWSKADYQEPEYEVVLRKERWSWEQASGLEKIPVGMSEKQWNKQSFKQKMLSHAERHKQPGEYKVEIEYVY